MDPQLGLCHSRATLKAGVPTVSTVGLTQHPGHRHQGYFNFTCHHRVLCPLPFWRLDFPLRPLGLLMNPTWKEVDRALESPSTQAKASESSGAACILPAPCHRLAGARCPLACAKAAGVRSWKGLWGWPPCLVLKPSSSY